MLSRPNRALTESAWIPLVLLAVALAWDASGLDLPLARLAGDARGFALRDHWLLSAVLHQGGRIAGWSLVLALVAGIRWPFGPLHRLARGERVRLAVATAVAALAVSLATDFSSTSCPWDLAAFGGRLPYVPHWAALADGGPGRCFPAGHASAGFAFFSGWFAFRPVHPPTADRWLLFAAAAGLAFGLAQQWRGAHFMSHTLWTAWLCWTSAWAVFALRLQQPARVAA